MELIERVATLEVDMRDVRDRLTRIEARLDTYPSIFATFATKADLHSEINAQTWKFVTWMSTIAAALVAATYFIAKHVS